MYELELLDGAEAAEETRDLLLHVAEVLTQDQLSKLCHVLGEGGPAYNLQVIHRLLAKRGRLDETKRLGALFTEYKKGFADPLVRATFLLGVKEVVKRDGQLSAEEVRDIMNEFEVEDTPDVRDELQRMAKSDGADSSWSILDVFGVALSSATVAQIARKVPWARIARLLLLRR